MRQVNYLGLIKSTICMWPFLILNQVHHIYVAVFKSTIEPINVVGFFKF